jgi:branched-subunit amino acid aminotransferase/4-amino-4-deoxychorismate lyase
MLDERGFVSEMNGTNIFMLRGGHLLTPHATNCLPGITRGIVLELGKELGIPTQERDLSLTELYTADEAFGTGTMGELTPVVEVDGRRIGNGQGGPLTAHLAEAFHARVASGRWTVPFP